jgi:hypothetical protein
VGVGLQPAGAALLMLTQLEFGVGSSVGLLADHRHHPTVGSDPFSSPQQAKHALGLVPLVVGGGEPLEDLVGLGPAGAGPRQLPRQLPRPIPGRLVQQPAEPVPLGPQLLGSELAQVQAAGVSIARVWPPVRERAWASWPYPSGTSRSGRSSSTGPWGSGPTTGYRVVWCRARDSCTYSQLLSSLPVSRTSARQRVRPWARWPVVA